ncbi:hypothetical protein LR48_Vigan01g116600 [Vigna angularis]|uniref:Uncharacterized protein n=1 Tax=Phaseolus angularis TaxID=3914 RepID=A0A0L9TMC7_PHAAN|nr:hypothetical protein LR48_Vigan01g116600 [Vigna angularis]
MLLFWLHTRGAVRSSLKSPAKPSSTVSASSAASRFASPPLTTVPAFTIATPTARNSAAGVALNFRDGDSRDHFSGLLCKLDTQRSSKVVHPGRPLRTNSAPRSSIQVDRQDRVSIVTDRQNRVAASQGLTSLAGRLADRPSRPSLTKSTIIQSRLDDERARSAVPSVCSLEQRGNCPVFTSFLCPLVTKLLGLLQLVRKRPSVTTSATTLDRTAARPDGRILAVRPHMFLVIRPHRSTPLMFGQSASITFVRLPQSFGHRPSISQAFQNSVSRTIGPIDVRPVGLNNVRHPYLKRSSIRAPRPFDPTDVRPSSLNDVRPLGFNRSAIRSHGRSVTCPQPFGLNCSTFRGLKRSAFGLTCLSASTARPYIDTSAPAFGPTDVRPFGLTDVRPPGLHLDRTRSSIRPFDPTDVRPFGLQKVFARWFQPLDHPFGRSTPLMFGHPASMTFVLLASIVRPLGLTDVRSLVLNPSASIVQLSVASSVQHSASHATRPLPLHHTWPHVPPPPLTKVDERAEEHERQQLRKSERPRHLEATKTHWKTSIPKQL